MSSVVSSSSVSSSSSSVPPIAAVSLQEVKAFLRLEHTKEDALLASWIRSAVILCESFTNQLLLIQGCTQDVGGVHEWHSLNAIPVCSVDRVKVFFADKTSTFLDPSMFEVTLNKHRKARVRLPALQDVHLAKIYYTAGQSQDWNDIPEPLRQGIIRLVAHFYAYRDSQDALNLPVAVSALWHPWRQMRVC